MPALPGHRPSVLLELDLTTVPIDPDPDDVLGQLRSRGRRQLRPTLRALHEAADDKHVVGLIAKVGGPLPWAAMQELRIGVRAFAASGKPTVAWAESFTAEVRDLAAYVLATAFDEIWLQPGGGLGLVGVGLDTTFLRGALDKLGIEPEFEQRYEYKNAPDRLTRTEFTPAHRESLEALAESVYVEAVETIAAGRELDESRVRALIDTGPRTAAEAREAGLVDELGYRDQVYAATRARFDEKADERADGRADGGVDGRADGGAGSEVELLFADRWQPRRKLATPPRRRDHVALVQANGGIGSGRSRRGPMGRQLGSDSVTAQLRAATEDDRVRALVLRVDSPGGSAVASDTIWREVCRVREAGKPVVVSMGEAAASGGYYIACPADVIVALPSTLTGSIGVFGGKFVVTELMERIGLTTGVVERGSRARMYSSRRTFTESERARLAAVIDAIYDDFVAKVAQGRGRTVEEIDAIARGRVWTGRDAREIGLVDELGGLRDAVRIARRRADLPDDAPVLAALHVPPLARLGRPKNSEDPRAMLTATRFDSARTDLTELLTGLGLRADHALRMPSLRLD